MSTEQVRAALAEPTPAMVDAYLKANAEYWARIDAEPGKLGVWRNGTPDEATMYSLRAALAAQEAAAGSAAPLRRGTTGVCSRRTCECESAGLGLECIWLVAAGSAAQQVMAEPSRCGLTECRGKPRCPMCKASGADGGPRDAQAAAGSAEPVATLHDDGCFTWKRDEFRLKYDRQRVGWRMDVYAAPQPPAAPAAALLRCRHVTTWANAAVDGKNHFSEWGPWMPTTYAHAKAVTDPSRNLELKLYEMLPLYL